MKGQTPIFSKGKDDWQTPPALFESLRREFPFTVDGAADRRNHLLPRWWGPGGWPEDALTASWVGEIVWLNPPYSQCAAFVAKAAGEAEEAISVVLVPSRTDTRWWHQYVWDISTNDWRVGVRGRFLKGRVKFIDTSRGRVHSGDSNSAPFPSVVLIFGG